jgi:hypothetical protein
VLSAARMRLCLCPLPWPLLLFSLNSWVLATGTPLDPPPRSPRPSSRLAMPLPLFRSSVAGSLCPGLALSLYSGLAPLGAISAPPGVQSGPAEAMSVLPGSYFSSNPGKPQDQLWTYKRNMTSLQGPSGLWLEAHKPRAAWATV